MPLRYDNQDNIDNRKKKMHKTILNMVLCVFDQLEYRAGGTTFLTWFWYSDIWFVEITNAQKYDKFKIVFRKYMFELQS